MHGNSISGAVAALAESINDALLAGHSTAELRREMATLEQRLRREAAEAAAEERARRAEAEAAEQAEIEARAAALVAEAEARLQARLAPLELPGALAIRRYPNGTFATIKDQPE